MLGFFGAPAIAAPLSSVGGADVKTDASAAKQVAQRCWRHRGHWHCRYYRGYRHGYYGYRAGRYHPNDPRSYRTGSRGWWDAKEREGSAGNRP
jgi:hypothetical protein